MPSKQEYKQVLNKLLGLEIDWAKLSKEELATLAAIFSEPEILAKKLGLDSTLGTKAAREKMIEAGFGVLQQWPGPLAQMARKVLGMEKPEEEKAPGEAPGTAGTGTESSKTGKPPG